MRVIFLDYDGVVNTPMWNEEGTRCSYAYKDKVNNFQACQWISELCEKTCSKIVVSSTWRMGPNYASCLYEGGLRSCVEIIGRTPLLRKGNRGDEICLYLKEHPEIDAFLIIDDEADASVTSTDEFKNINLQCTLCQCKHSGGFNENEFIEAKNLFEFNDIYKVYEDIFSKIRK